MAKPEEVLVVENEQGEVVREFMKDTDAINMYKSMRETLGKEGKGTKEVVDWYYQRIQITMVLTANATLTFSHLCFSILPLSFSSSPPSFLFPSLSPSLSPSLLLPLVYLTHLDYADTEHIMTDKLYRQVDGTEWSWKNLNTVCTACVHVAN